MGTQLRKLSVEKRGEVIVQIMKMKNNVYGRAVDKEIN
jgi:hypothetical protein